MITPTGLYISARGNTLGTEDEIQEFSLPSGVLLRADNYTPFGRFSVFFKCRNNLLHLPSPGKLQKDFFKINILIFPPRLFPKFFHCPNDMQGAVGDDSDTMTEFFRDFQGMGGEKNRAPFFCFWRIPCE